METKITINKIIPVRPPCTGSVVAAQSAQGVSQLCVSVCGSLVQTIDIKRKKEMYAFLTKELELNCVVNQNVFHLFE